MSNITLPTSQVIAAGGLTNDEVGLRAPAALTTGSHRDGASDRYRQVSTLAIMDAARAEGFMVVGASQPSGSLKDPKSREFSKHRVDLILPSARHGSEGYPTMTILNSHDRTKALTAIMGYFRLVCENGMIVASGPYDRVRSLHLGDALSELPVFIRRAAESLRKTHELVEPMMARKTSAPERSVFASLVMESRWAGYPKVPVTPAMILKARRAEDEGDDLWRVANRVQENVVRGGLVSVLGRRTHGVESFYGNITVNQLIWRGAEAVMAGSVSRVNRLRRELAASLEG